METKFRDQLQEIKAIRRDLKVRYIKLGHGGGAAKDCFQENLLYIGFDTHLSDVRGWCNEARDPNKRKKAISKIKKHWIEQPNVTTGTATIFTNSMLAVSDDKGMSLWLTFHKRKIYYGLTAGGDLERYQRSENIKPNIGSSKRMKYGWCCHDIENNALEINKLSGSLTKTQAARGTIALIKDNPARYFINRLLGEPLQLQDEAVDARNKLKESLAAIIKDLQPSEFEVLVDLIFANSGWRRDSELGGNIKFVDLTLRLPTTGEKAGVQVKTQTNKQVSQQYIDGDYTTHDFDKFFYVFHTGDAITPKKDPNYFVWSSSEVAEAAIDAGLSQWIIDRAYQ